MKIIVTKELYSPGLCARNPSWLFVYGDNLAGHGKGGQACIRDCPNSHGIPTKNAPRQTPDAYFSDDNLEANKTAIDQSFQSILSYARANFSAIVFPSTGIGTGLARLEEKAPKTFEYLCIEMIKCFGFDNETGQLRAKD